MKKMTKRMILSVITLVLVVVALGTTTFAWFTLSTTATVSDITGTVQAGEGLEIALSVGAINGGPTATEFKTNLVDSDWKKILGPSGLIKDNEFSFGAVSTSNGVGFSTLAVSSHKEAGFTWLDKVAAPNANETKSYLEFNIHFKSDSEGFVNWTGFDFEAGTSYAFTPGVDFINGRNDNAPAQTPITFNASNAARIGLFGHNGTNPNNVFVQKPEAAAAETSSSDNTANNQGQVNGQFSYMTAKNNKINWTDTPGANTNVVPTDVNLVNAITDLDGSPTIAKLVETNNRYEAVVTVKVWLEGWDADMYDAIFRSILNFNLDFDKATAAS